MTREKGTILLAALSFISVSRCCRYGHLHIGLLVLVVGFSNRPRLIPVARLLFAVLSTAANRRDETATYAKHACFIDGFGRRYDRTRNINAEQYCMLWVCISTLLLYINLLYPQFANGMTLIYNNNILIYIYMKYNIRKISVYEKCFIYKNMRFHTSAALIHFFFCCFGFQSSSSPSP